MKERPILFSGQMVRAILEGRKTQTRRIIKPNRGGVIVGMVGPGIAMEQINEFEFSTVVSPYGQLGDRLWVRETWRVSKNHDGTKPANLPFDRGLSVAYSAGGMMCRDEVGGPYASHPNDDLWSAEWMGKSRPSIHMPRLASRILLEVTGVRVERLQDISETDAKAEGADCLITANCTDKSRALLDMPLMEDANPYRNGYALLWESINGDGSWDANPWVWVVEFKQVAA